MQIAINNVNNFTNLYAVYEHVLADGKVIFINLCRLTEVFTLKQARDNSEWRKLFANGGGMFINIIHTTNDEIEGRNFASKRIAELGYRPHCNLYGHDLRVHNRRIRCSNGEIYNSQSDAARALGLHQGNLSKHMKGFSKTIGGYWFEYVDDDKPIPPPLAQQPPADPYPGYTGIHTIGDGTVWGFDANGNPHQLGTTQQ